MKGLLLLAVAALGQGLPDGSAFADPSPNNNPNTPPQKVLQQDSHSPLAPSDGSQRPNIVFILVDDQDLQMDSLLYTPRINRHLAQQGTFYANHFVTTALCCPSRVSLWTGKQAHNTNVTEIYPPYGGYPKFVAEGHNDNWLPLWLQAGGYDTYYTGKLFNAHTVDNYDAPFVNGFNASDFVLDPYTYQYRRPVYQRNRDAPVNYHGQHTVDVLAAKTLGLLDDALAGERPFFLGVAPVAPHSNLEMADETDTTSFRFSAPIPASRHQHLFPEARVPRTPNFNPDRPSGVNWIRRLPQQNASSVAYNDEFYRNRLRALQAVDELVEDIVGRLERAHALDHTYLFYTSDNGYHIGQHRLHPGKECGFEEDIRVPMFVRGPGVPAGHEVDSVTTHIDLAPTLFRIAGLAPKEEFDGTAMPLTAAEIEADRGSRQEHVNVEYWGKAGFEGAFGRAADGGPTTFLNNTYKALRVVSPRFNLYYSVWCSDEHQLYDLTVDPYQLHNLYPDIANPQNKGRGITIGGHPADQVASRLDALLMVLKSCQGATCIRPWQTLHPAGDVASLQDALEGRFDAFYASQVRVEYGWCELGYIVEAEGPQVPRIYQETHWSDWV
ncbi:Arylsulphatase [Aspergillus heteromorphus CBS 117.55]|uniref:Arylsulfatase n=1 Tax=Aspergillus heteromorphus CBS 117.55 TaxID=1448321 RepID=A0A317UXM0_9EURO|nr:Arylsulphatase [Aspergillus heteromorphus CBS 117.55]PWY66783.1 Arylsulphatase [Aspergillus heteromorphus CBS 117.55]